MSTNTGHPSHDLGSRAEQLVVDNLIERGYTILSRNWHRRGGEIDIVARSGDAIHFIEVKGQAAQREGFEAHRRADNHKMQRVRNTALAWLANHGRSQETPWQLDIVEVTLGKGEGCIRHFMNVRPE